MILIPLVALVAQQKTSLQVQKEIAIASKITPLLFKNLQNVRAWKADSEDPYSVNCNAVVVAFSKTDPSRVSRISRLDLADRMTNGPRQGEAFKSISEWEAHGFKQIQTIWKDVDGYLGVVKKTGEDARASAGQKRWSNLSNTMALIWFTHPVNGMQRQFSVGMELATGEVLHMSCGEFRKAPKVIEKSWILMDKSKTRKTKIALPPL